MKKNSHFGKIIIIGKTNSGKSTLLNKIIGKNISITSHKYNTTQKNIIGIYTEKNIQYEIIDSPGIPKNDKHVLFDISKKNIFKIVKTSNLVIFLISELQWSIIEEKIFQFIRKNNNNYVIVINKIDLIKNKKMLLPYIEKIKKITYNAEIILISAKKEKYIEDLLEFIKKKIPIADHKYSTKKIFKNDIKFLISEIIRGEMINLLNKEIPYQITIKILNIYKNLNNEYVIKSGIFVYKKNHKKIIIGCNGQRIKLCSLKSRLKIGKYFNEKIHLKLWVYIKKKDKV